MTNTRNIQTITINHNGRAYTGKFENNLSVSENEAILRGAIKARETIERLFGMIHEY